MGEAVFADDVVKRVVGRLHHGKPAQADQIETLGHKLSLTCRAGRGLFDQAQAMLGIADAAWSVAESIRDYARLIGGTNDRVIGDLVKNFGVRVIPESVVGDVEG